MGPLITLKEHEAFRAAMQSGTEGIECSLDLGLSTTRIAVGPDGWSWQGRFFPHLKRCRERTIYYWIDNSFQPISRYTKSLIKLIPTHWGPPTFEINGVKMLPTEDLSPYMDAKRKVDSIKPRGKVILDTCGGLGYFAAWCAKNQAKRVFSYEANPDVIWLRGLNPWSPRANDVLTLTVGDICSEISLLSSESFDAVLHDPPRFGIAGELYSQTFYDQLARVLMPKGMLFHYTGSPNKLTSGRNVSREVAKRLQRSGFVAELSLDGVLARKN